MSPHSRINKTHRGRTAWPIALTELSVAFLFQIGMTNCQAVTIGWLTAACSSDRVVEGIIIAKLSGFLRFILRMSSYSLATT